MTPFLLSVSLVSFVVAVVSYSLVLFLLLPSNPRTRQSWWLLSAIAGSAVWAGILVGVIAWTRALPGWLLLVDASRMALWVFCICAFLPSSSGWLGRRLSRLLSAVAAASVVSVVVLTASGLDEAGTIARLILIAMLVLPLMGLLGLEQVFRNTNLDERRFVKPFAICVGAVFAVDIFVYSQALLFGTVGALAWSLRGLVSAACAPLIMLAVKRAPDWGENLFVSRHVVFYTTSLTAAGLYLLTMAAGGFLIGAMGLTWGPALQILFMLLAAALLFYVLYSQASINRFKVFIAKHFFRNRYDYREEWLRLMQTLAGTPGDGSLPERSVRTLAQIIASPRGELWLFDREQARFEACGTWPASVTTTSLDSDGALVKFIRETRWVVDTEEARQDPETYANAFADAEEPSAVPSIFVPLVHDDELAGIVRLDRPAGLGQLGYEDHDLLKTAGQQVAIFLIQERDQEELSLTRQFEAFSRLTAFLMHDLKNMIAQQELVLGNAKRFKHRPEFVDDAFATIDSSVRRMRSVLERLQSSERNDQTVRVDVGKVLQEVVSNCSDREPLPGFAYDGPPLWVSIDRDRLGMVVTHAIRNAQDATDPSGSVQVRLDCDGGSVFIEIEDSGTGMDESFIREHLFKPFDSTKGAKGMGIGAYQIRETLRSAGGDVGVSSAPGEGTVVTMRLPLTSADEAATATSIASGEDFLMPAGPRNSA